MTSLALLGKCISTTTTILSVCLLQLYQAEDVVAHIKDVAKKKRCHLIVVSETLSVVSLTTTVSALAVRATYCGHSIQFNRRMLIINRVSMLLK